MAVLHLYSDETARLNAAQRALLAPLATGDPIVWQLQANRAVRRFVEADHSLFAIGNEAGPRIVTDDTDPTFPDRLRGYYLGVDEGDLRFRDRLMEKMGARRRRLGVGAYHQDMLMTPSEVRRSPARHELFVPARLTCLIGLSVPRPVGEVTEFFGFTGAEADARSQRGFARLQLLVPAFEAGVHAHERFAARRAALASLLDQLSEPLCVYTGTGLRLHRNRAFSELLAEEPDAPRLEQAADALALTWSFRANRHGKTATPAVPAESQHTLRSRRGTEYRLLVTHVGADVFGTECVLVILEPLTAKLLPSAEIIRSRFGLTAREAEVSLLLAEGLTDAAIAARLLVSRHTARRYVERVLRKLGLHTRAAVALTLLRDARSMRSTGDEPSVMPGVRPAEPLELPSDP